MESVKKWLSERTAKKNGVYVHYSPPKLGVVSEAQLRAWARGPESSVERAVLAGQGRRLLAEVAALPHAHTQLLTALLEKCDALHDAVEKGSLLQLQELLEADYNRRKFVMCRDEAGVGLLHKAVYYDFMDIAEYLVQNYPQLVHVKDSEGRTPLHYAALCRDEASAARLLEQAGAARGARDASGRTPAAYRGNGRTLLTLPSVPSDITTDKRQVPGLVIKRHNIRIWCHDCDMSRLQRVVWEGHGSRLLSEVSNQPVVKKFLEAVPYIMNTIKDIHTAVVDNDLEAVMKHSGDPVPPQALSSRDGNNMTVMHKAAGLGHSSILKYLAERYPQGVNDIDNDGRTPLHYAAAVRDDQHTYNTLVNLGADESIVDNKNKTPAYYVNRPQEIDKSLFKTIPDAPRTPSSAYPSTWDWKLLDNYVITDLNKKTRKKNLRASTENISSKNNTMSESTENLASGMKASSTHEFISDLPELEETVKASNDTENDAEEKQVTNEEDQVVEENQDTAENEEENSQETASADEVEQPQDEPSNEAEEEHNEEPEKEDHHEGNVEEGSAEYQEDQEDKTNGGDTVVPPDTVEEADEQTATNEINVGDNSEKTDDTKDQAPESHDEVSSNVNDPQNDEQSDNIDKDISTSEIKENGQDESRAHDEHIVDSEKVLELEDNIDKPINVTADHDSEENHQENDTNEEVNDKDEDGAATRKEGNNNSSGITEDDDDVQVQGGTNSEYSEYNLVSTAEASDTGSAKIGYVGNGRNSQESLIEGLVNEEGEQDDQDASITQRDESVHGEVLTVDSEIDPEVTDLINTANMEMLATLVLNGEGSRLIGRRSGNSELQGFLDNVPSYMQKINQVHVAAKEGNLKNLQAALDRRKFAIARDPISSNGATPMHVATVFGKTNIIKYLGSRFPETLSAVDFEGRTALHYAAVLPDNGHYYSLMQQLGANAKDLDDNGRSTEEYIKNPSLLPFEQLLSDFGISDEAIKTMFSDKVPEDQVSSRRNLDTPEVLETLERCYRLLASARPARTPLSASSNRATPPLVLGRFLKKPIFDVIKYRITKLDHDLFDVIWPAVKKIPDNRNLVQTIEEDFPGGITAPDYYVYAVFNDFLTPLIKDLHNMHVTSELPLHPESDFLKTSTAKLSTEPLVELNIDPTESFVLSGYIECSRNLEGFELPLNVNIGKLEAIERIVTTILMQENFTKFSDQPNPESDQKGGTYYTLNEVLEKPSEIGAALASNGLLISLCDRDEFDDCARLHGRHWPYGRGVFVSDDKTIAIWINVHDHIRVLVSTASDSPGEIGLPFSKLSYIMTHLHQKLDFVWDNTLGHLSSRPTFLGAGIRFSLIVNFPGLSKDPDNMKHLCAMRGLQYRETLSSEIARIRPSNPDNGHTDIPIFQTEEGRYLAKSLGDPLIKGLTEVANVKPKDPVAFLASFLHNFPEHEKPRLGTPQVPTSNLLVAQEDPEVENEQAAPLEAQPVARLPRSATRTATRPHRPIDVVTVDPQPVTSPDAPETAFSSAKRDEHGQSMLHFAAARTHAKNALFQLLQESDVSLGYRDELYRTARDVSTQANVPDNTAEIDRFVLHLAARGNKEKIMELLMEGYDHILDVVDEEGVSINDVIAQRGDTDMINMLSSIPAFEESRDGLHGAVRRGDLGALKQSLQADGGRTLVRSQNSFGRTALHIAVLAQHEEVVAYLAQNYPELLRIGDNLERTPLHYAMGVQEIESLSRVLIRSGAKRVLKDLKGRQPSYYFMNKSDILRLQEEEEIY